MDSERAIEMFSKHQNLVSKMKALVLDRDPIYRLKVGSYLEVNGFAKVDTINYHRLATMQLKRADRPILIVADGDAYYDSTWEIIGTMRTGVKTVAVLDAHDISNDDYLRTRRADAYVSRHPYLMLLGHNILRAIAGLDRSLGMMMSAQVPRTPGRGGAEVLPFRRRGAPF